MSVEERLRGALAARAEQIGPERLRHAMPPTATRPRPAWLGTWLPSLAAAAAVIILFAVVLLVRPANDQPIEPATPATPSAPAPKSPDPFVKPPPPKEADLDPGPGSPAGKPGVGIWPPGKIGPGGASDTPKRAETEQAIPQSPW